MKFTNTLFAITLALYCGTLRAAAQGGLTPPGPPGPTTTLIEPRTPIAAGALSAPVNITASGSYYLTGNITVTTGDAIDINASGVTLDLNGFTISSTDPNNSGNGISIKSGTMIHILNGNIIGNVTESGGNFTGSGFAYGINGLNGYNTRVTGISVVGCLDDGINVGNGYSSIIESCSVNTVGGTALVAATVVNSIGGTCGMGGIECITAENCYAFADGFSDGLYANNAINCSASSYSTYGLYAVCTAQNCYGITTSSTDAGIYANTAQNCYGVNDGTGSGDGIDASCAENCYGQTSGSTLSNGISARTAQNCYGVGLNGGTGLLAKWVAENCYGLSEGSSYVEPGIQSDNSLVNCYGESDSPSGFIPPGISTTMAESCYGASYNTSGHGHTPENGLNAQYANFCFCTGSAVVYGAYYNMPAP